MSASEPDFCQVCYRHERPADEPLRYPEPFETVQELVGEHGSRVVIEELATLAKYDAEDKEDTCSACRVEATWLNMELSQLMDRYELLFPAPEPEVSHEGSELVQ